MRAAAAQESLRKAGGEGASFKKAPMTHGLVHLLSVCFYLCFTHFFVALVLKGNLGCEIVAQSFGWSILPGGPTSLAEMKHKHC